jgi:catalase
VERFVEAMRKRGAIPEVLAPTGGGTLSGGSGGEVDVDRAINTMASVLYDAVVVPCGPDSVQTLSGDGYALHFVTEAYKHLKPVAAFGAGIGLLRKAGVAEQLADGAEVVAEKGVVSTTAAEDTIPDEFFEAFASALAKHRAWDRETDSVPA